MEIRTKDNIVRRVLKKMDQRSLIGQQKYGDTMESEIERREKGLYHFMEDVQEELMDALLYLESAKYCLKDEIQYIAKRMNKNVSDIEVNDEEEL
jgi:hypothetical protein